MKYRCCDPVAVPCELCGQPTNMTATRRCDRCWELESRIRADPQLAHNILTLIGREIAAGQSDFKGGPPPITLPREIDNR